MKLEIQWSLHSEFTYEAIYLFVLQKWGFDIAENLRLQILKTLDQISERPYIYQISPIDGVRKAVILKYTSLFYKVFDDYILLVFFWDNRKQPLF
jgi:plasmid stabilization system protein ParE